MCRSSASTSILFLQSDGGVRIESERFEVASGPGGLEPSARRGHVFQ